MRAALISLVGQPRDGGTSAPLAVGGKTLAERQLEFARAAGCEKIILIGEGASRDAIALGHVAERAGLLVRAVTGARGLLGSVMAGDELLVMAPGLLPDAPAAIAALAGPPTALVLPAGSANAGFERIDLERAWAGALVLPGAWVERLADLPADIDPPPALLRIALQAGIKEHGLSEALLLEGAWSIVGDADADRTERAWLARRLVAFKNDSPTEQLATGILRRLHAPLLRAGWAALGLGATAVAGLAVASGLAWTGFGAFAFVIIAASSLSTELGQRLTELRASPFAARSGRMRVAAGLLVDLALVACAAGVIEGPWPHKLFPPLVLVGLLRSRSGAWLEWVADRALLALVLAFAAVFGFVEQVLMALALAAIALDAARSARWLG